jgi:translocation and assembly module TamA
MLSGRLEVFLLSTNALVKTFAAALIALAGVSGSAWAQIDYKVDFKGAPNGLGKELELASTLAAHDLPVATRAALAAIADRDAKDLVLALQAAGYYAASVRHSIEGPDAPTVQFEVESGPLFRITAYEISYRDDETGRPQSLADAEIDSAAEADGAALEELQRQFLSRLWNDGYPAARILARRAEADFRSGTARAIFEFESGPRAVFGDLRVSGAEKTRIDYLEKLTPWSEGELYERDQLVEYRDRLMASGLFSSVDVEPGAVTQSGQAPVIAAVGERKPRTIGVGLSYSTSEGPGARLFFDYRNLFGRGELAHVEGEGSGVKQGLALNLAKPLPGFPGSAFAQLAFENETTDAFNARTVRLGGGLSRLWLDDKLDTRAAVAFESSKVRSDVSEERTYLVSFPISAAWNSEDDILNPSKGVRISVVGTPYFGSSTFSTLEANARTRFNFGADDRFTAALRARAGSAFWSRLADIPLNRRLYAGGGASIRGYGFQEAGPLDVDGAPTGGRSVVETAFEARARVAEKLQIAAFIDAGTVADAPLPDLSNGVFAGAGAGVRYLTPLGPIRIDVATPLRKRPTDRGFQIYISLGQPF